MMEYMEISSLFLNNINIMLFITLGELIVSGCIILVGHVITKQKVKRFGKYLIKQGFLTLALFSIFNISFSAATQWKYADSTQDEYYYISSVLLYLSLISILGIVIALEVTKRKEFGEFKNNFKRDFVSKLYITISFVYRMALGFYIGLESDYEEGTFLILGFSLMFIMYNIVNLPFKNVFENYRANVIHLTQFIILMVANYYKGMKSTTHIANKAR